MAKKKAKAVAPDVQHSERPGHPDDDTRTVAVGEGDEAQDVREHITSEGPGTPAEVEVEVED